LTSFDELLDRRLKELEAALYSAGRPLTIEEIQPVIGTRSDNVANDVVDALRDQYASRNRALEIVRLDDGRAVMQLKEVYDEFVKQFNSKPLLKLGPLKTLSYVAFHQPVDQRQVIADRGNHVYSHLRMMENMGLIHRERTEERSYMITTTSFYADYFGFSNNPERSRIQLKQIFRDLKITKLENGAIDNLFDDVIEGLEKLDDMEKEEKELANPRDGLTQGLPQYTGSSNDSSK
jgi:segregation and condensation protein B